MFFLFLWGYTFGFEVQNLSSVVSVQAHRLWLLESHVLWFPACMLPIYFSLLKPGCICCQHCQAAPLSASQSLRFTLCLGSSSRLSRFLSTELVPRADGGPGWGPAYTIAPLSCPPPARLWLSHSSVTSLSLFCAGLGFRTEPPHLLPTHWAPGWASSKSSRRAWFRQPSAITVKCPWSLK